MSTPAPGLPRPAQGHRPARSSTRSCRARSTPPSVRSGPFRSRRQGRPGPAMAERPRHTIHDHHHHDLSRAADAHIGSFCLTFDEPLDWDRSNRWLMGVRGLGRPIAAREGRARRRGRDAAAGHQHVHRTFHPPTCSLAGPTANANRGWCSSPATSTAPRSRRQHEVQSALPDRHASAGQTSVEALEHRRHRLGSNAEALTACARAREK